MKLIKSSVDVLEQEPGIEGMFKHIEKIGRLSHKSEDKITSNSYENFIKLMKNCGHYAVFNMGTVYLRLSILQLGILKKLLKHYPFTKICFNKFSAYITTDYRVILQENLEEEMYKYWCEPTCYHYRKVTAHFICSRAISHELVRHASLRPMQESTRYCNYNKDKFNRELTYIIPEWVYKLQKELSETIDPLTKEDRKWLLDLDGEELWYSLCTMDRTIASRSDLLKKIEDQYLYETSTDESYKLRPEDARGILPHDLKTELYMCGYLKDWRYRPKTKERTGFFYLRSDNSAHPDVRVLSQKLEKIFDELYGDWK